MAYEAEVAREAVGLLLKLGAYGLDRSKQDDLWQQALQLKARLEPGGEAASFLARWGTLQAYRAANPLPHWMARPGDEDDGLQSGYGPDENNGEPDTTTR
jgi:hypothetical protein